MHIHLAHACAYIWHMHVHAGATTCSSRPRRCPSLPCGSHLISGDAISTYRPPTASRRRPSPPGLDTCVGPGTRRNDAWPSRQPSARPWTRAVRMIASSAATTAGSTSASSAAGASGSDGTLRAESGPAGCSRRTRRLKQCTRPRHCAGRHEGWEAA